MNSILGDLKPPFYPDVGGGVWYGIAKILTPEETVRILNAIPALESELTDIRERYAHLNSAYQDMMAERDALKAENERLRRYVDVTTELFDEITCEFDNLRPRAWEFKDNDGQIGYDDRTIVNSLAWAGLLGYMSVIQNPNGCLDMAKCVKDGTHSDLPFVDALIAIRTPFDENEKMKSGNNG